MNVRNVWTGDRRLEVVSVNFRSSGNRGAHLIVLMQRVELIRSIWTGDWRVVSVNFRSKGNRCGASVGGSVVVEVVAWPDV